MMEAGYAVLQPLLSGLWNATFEPKSGNSTHDGYSRRTPGLLFTPDNKSGSADQPAAQQVGVQPTESSISSLSQAHSRPRWTDPTRRSSKQTVCMRRPLLPRRPVNSLFQSRCERNSALLNNDAGSGRLSYSPFGPFSQAAGP